MQILAVGDVAPRRDDPAGIFAAVAAILRGSDLTFGQMECPISDRGEAAPQARLAMRTDPAVAPVLRAAGFDVMSVAGNHALDFGVEALADTLVHLEAAGIASCGAGANIEAARKPAIARVQGKTVALLAYSSILPAGYAAGDTRAGVAPMHAHTHYRQIERDQPGTPAEVLTFADSAQLEALIADVRRAKTQADIVLVSIHWGIHFVRAEIADYQREVAFTAIEAGADAIIGHHPHLLKGIEFHRGKPIFYSLGNFAIEQPAAFDETIRDSASFKHLQTLSDGWQPTAKYQTPPETRHTAIAKLDFVDGALAVLLLPCRIDDDSVPHPLSPASGDWDEWLDYVTAITAEAGLDTVYAASGDHVICRPAPQAE